MEDDFAEENGEDEIEANEFNDEDYQAQQAMLLQKINELKQQQEFNNNDSNDMLDYDDDDCERD